MNGRLHNKAWKKAREHFGIENDPSMVLHHIDTTLRATDTKRYLEWRIEDLAVMTKAEHTKLHQTGRIVSDETRKKMSENHVGFEGKHHTAETIEKIKAKTKGVPKSEEAKANMNANRACLRGKDNPNSKPILCVELGRIFWGAAEAERELGISKTGITRCCNHIKYYNTAGGYHWRWADA